MESFQGPLSSCFFGEVKGLVDTESLEEQHLISSLEDNMPFLQMLQSVESPLFQTLIRVKKPWEGIAMELESCVTHDLESLLKFESNDQYEDCSEGGAGHTGPKTEGQGERKKRKRKRTKNKEEVENQRMTHIAVERNRRRQMNDHLSVLKSLMPPSYIQRGDHASIIGGAIDFVKELEQLLQSLEAQKRMRKKEDAASSEHGYEGEVRCGDEVKAEKKSEAVSIEVNVIQTHVNLKIQCQRRPGQLIKAIVALEDLRLPILHLNVTSSEATVLYSFNLKIEEDSKIVSANDIAEAVNHMFSSISDS